MKTAQERVQAFKADLAELLAKHGAELVLRDMGRSYMPDEHIWVEMNSIWSEDGQEHLGEYADADLGTWYDGIKRALL